MAEADQPLPYAVAPLSAGVSSGPAVEPHGIPKSLERGPNLAPLGYVVPIDANQRGAVRGVAAAPHVR